jgi:predicted CoA-binding protein
LFKSLTETNGAIEVVDLVINPVKGLEVVEEMGKLGIKSLWIQPGAGSKEILETAQRLGISVHEGKLSVWESGMGANVV